jgi:hypothetical protein
MLLFPVISATDDLHAMRPEMEESSSSKRIVKPIGGVKASVKLTGAVPWLAQMAVPAFLYFDDQNCGAVIQRSFSPTIRGAIAESAGRAPPSYLT